MSITPSARLLKGVGLWVALAAAAVVFPWLGLVSAVGAVALAATALLDAIALLRQRPIALEREIPERLWLGRPAEMELRLHHRGEQPVAVEVFEEIPEDLGDPSPSWRRVLPPGGEVRIGVALCPRVRGTRPLGVPVALEASPLGLFRRRVQGSAGGRVRVVPDTRALLPRDALDPRWLRATLGIRPARRRGEGAEFDSLRDYVPGDDPRQLDWAASVRRGRPIVKQFRHERNHTVLIALDTSRLMAGRDARSSDRTKLDFAVEAALALACSAVASGDRVGLAVFDRELRAFLPPRRQRRDLGALVELLTDVQPRIVEPDFARLARSLAVRQSSRALLVILTDFAETETGSFHGPLSVLARRHRVLLVALRDRVFRELEVAQGEARPPDLTAAYRRIVVDDLLAEREAALLSLRRRGLLTLDLPPARITGALLNRYLALRESR